MYYWLPVSSLFSKPLPPKVIQSPGILSIIFGSGLASILLVVVSLVLLIVIFAVIWMFMTGRWLSARSVDVIAPASSPASLSTSAVYARADSSSPASPSTSAVYARAGLPSEVSQMSPRPAPRYNEADAAPLHSKQPLSEDLLKNTRWLRLAEDCVDLFDELDNIFPRLDPPRQEIVRHVKYRLQEILNRSGVTSISRGSVFDETRHQLEQVDTTTVPGTPITKFVSPGFVVDGRVLRRAKVQVADILQEDAGKNL